MPAEDFPPPSIPQGFSGYFSKSAAVLERLVNLWPLTGTQSLPHTKIKSSPSEDSQRKYEGRLIYYYVADDDGNVDDSIEGPCFQLKGNRLKELIQKLEEETGLEDIMVCCRNRVNGKLYPLRLALPPDNATMHAIIVPSASKAANGFMPPATTSPSIVDHHL